MSTGDTVSELDMHFIYCTISALTLSMLDQLDWYKTVVYLVEHRNFDGRFGSIVGTESHAVQSVSQCALFSSSLHLTPTWCA